MPSIDQIYSEFKVLAIRWDAERSPTKANRIADKLDIITDTLTASPEGRKLLSELLSDDEQAPVLLFKVAYAALSWDEERALHVLRALVARDLDYALEAKYTLMRLGH